MLQKPYAIIGGMILENDALHTLEIFHCKKLQDLVQHNAVIIKEYHRLVTL